MKKQEVSYNNKKFDHVEIYSGVENDISRGGKTLKKVYVTFDIQITTNSFSKVKDAEKFETKVLDTIKEMLI